MSQHAARLRAAVRDEWPPWPVIAAYATLVASLLIVSAFAGIYDRFPGDVWLTRRIQDTDAPLVRDAMRAATNITNPTNSIIALLVAVTLFLAMRRPRLAVFAVAALSAHALGAVLKFFVDRHRPDPSLVDTVRFEEQYSYPSGHVEWVVSFEGFLVFAVWQLTRDRIIRAAAVAAWFVHLLLTSAGRVDQGLHWPSDIVASYQVGAIALLLVLWLYRLSFGVIPAGDERGAT